MTPDATLVQQALQEQGLETPRIDNGLDSEEKYQHIKRTLS